MNINVINLTHWAIKLLLLNFMETTFLTGIYIQKSAFDLDYVGIKASQFSTIIIYENGKINKSVDFSTESQITIKENIIQELINLNDI